MEKKITVNENIIDWEEGMTVAKVLKVMKYSFRMLIISIDGKVVPKDKYETTIVPEGANVKVIHLMSGG